MAKQRIGHEPGVSAVSVRERMNRDQHMMEPCCDFIDGKGLVIEPVLHVGEKVLRALRHGLPRDADGWTTATVRISRASEALSPTRNG